MQLFLIRHAEAVALGSGRIRDDEERPLTERGRGDVRRAALALRGKGVALDRILTSPRMRAVQTAEILACGLGHRGPVDSLPLLGRGDGWREGLEPALEELAALGAGSLGVVGHNPDLSNLAAKLVGAPEGTVALPACAVCGFDLPGAALGDGGRLAWWLDPRDFSFRPSL